MIRISGVRGLVLQTSVFEESNRFYSEAWGLRRLPDSTSGVSYFAGSGPEPWILGLRAAEAAALERIRLAVGSADEVDVVWRALTERGMEMDGAPRALEGPGNYRGFAFKDPDGRWTEISWSSPVFVANDSGAARAERLSHIVLNSTQARRLAEFYVSVLGFSISDWYERDQLIFLRCGQDHHCVGIAQARNCSLNHMAFLVEDLEAVMYAMGGIKRARKADPIWGPGRHGPGGNVFAYFEDPAGFVTEYTAELIQITDPTEWVAKEWQRTPQNGNVWGTGGPTPRAIALMEGGPQVASAMNSIHEVEE